MDEEIPLFTDEAPSSFNKAVEHTILHPEAISLEPSGFSNEEPDLIDPKRSI